ncbi:hypothetical protein Tco_0217912 [Tanacetum coccineum]
MAHMGFCDKHNMVAFLQKPSGSEEFHQIVAFLTGSHIRTHLQLADVDGVHVPLFDTMLIHDQSGQGEGPTLSVESQHTPIVSPHTSQPTTSQPTASHSISSPKHSIQKPTSEPTSPTSPPSTEPQIQETTSTLPHDSPLPGGYTPGSVEGSMKLTELTDLCTKLVDRVTSLETELTKTKQLYGKAITKLVKKVKHLEDKLKSTKARRKARIVFSDEKIWSQRLLPNRGGWKSQKLKQEITPLKAQSVQDQSTSSFEANLSLISAAKILAEASTEKIKTYKKRRRSTDSSKVGTVEGTAKGIFSTAEDIQGIDEEVARKVQEEEQVKAMEQQEQERLNLEAAKELQRQLDQRQETDDIDWSTVVEQVQERQSGSMIRYQTLKKKPVTVAQATKNMKIYLKNMAGYKMTNFKGMTYDQIRPIFEKEYNKVHTLFQRDYEVGKLEKKRVAEETEDLDTLWRLVKEKFTSAEPVEDMEKALWVELKRLYEPDKDDILWKLQRYMHDPLTWRLYRSCAVHHVSSTRGHDIFKLIEKDYPLTTAVMALMLGRSLQVEEYSEMARDLIRKIFREADNPRS